MLDRLGDFYRYLVRRGLTRNADIFFDEFVELAVDFLHSNYYVERNGLRGWAMIGWLAFLVERKILNRDEIGILSAVKIVRDYYDDPRAGQLL